MKYYDFLNEKFNKMLNEAKQDEINFSNVFGEDILTRFKAQKQRLQSPENDFYYWIRKSREDLEGTIEELEATLTRFESSLTRSQKRQLAAAGADLLYEDDEWIVLKINTYEAAAKYGAGTVWCITGRYHGHEDRGEHFFKSYKEDYGWDYYFFIKKDGRDIEGRQIKWCVCWNGDDDLDNEENFQIWEGDQHERGERQVSYIPNAPQVPGLPDVSEPHGWDEGEPEEEPEPEWEDEEPEDWGDEEDGEEREPIHHEPPAPPAYDIKEVEDPNAFEFPADSKEEAASMFKRGAEIVETVREPDLHIVKWHEEPTEEGDNGDRFSLFVFLPGEGGGPLLAQTGNGFGLQVFKDLDKVKEFAGHMPGLQIMNNRDNFEGMPESLKEKFNYINLE